MSKNAVNRVTTAVAAVTERIEKASADVVTNLQQTADETINKFGKVQDVLISPLKEANKMLDELIYGDNGGPALDDAKFPAAEGKGDGEVSGDPSTLSTAAVPEWIKKIAE